MIGHLMRYGGLVNFKSSQCISIIEDCYWFLCSAFTAEQLIKPVLENQLGVCMSLCPHLCPAMWQGKSTSMAEWMGYAGTLFCALTFLSGMDCGGACREELLWACVFLCAWQRTSCISPEQHIAHALTSAVALTNLNLTWPGSPTSLLQSGANWRNKMHKDLKWNEYDRITQNTWWRLSVHILLHLCTLP